MKLYLHSSDTTNNKFKLDEPISGLWKLQSFCCTNNIFNVNNNNNKIYINENGTDYTVTLTNGYYDFNSLQSHLQTQITSTISGTMTVTTDSNTNKYTFSNTITFYFTFGTNTTNSARKLIGFNQIDGTTSTTQTSDNPIDLNNHKSFFINISENDDRDIIGTSYFNTSLFISGEGGFGDIIRYKNVDNFNQFVKFRNTKTLEFSFHDINNNTIDLNSDYEIILEHVAY